jgi:hypothetical protein
MTAPGLFVHSPTSSRASAALPGNSENELTVVIFSFIGIPRRFPVGNGSRCRIQDTTIISLHAVGSMPAALRAAPRMTSANEGWM